jgi:hypothetical protein
VDGRPDPGRAPVHQLLPGRGPGQPVPDHPGDYRGDQSWRGVFYRTLAFKIFNRVSTWRLLAGESGEVTWAEYDFGRLNQVLQAQLDAGGRLYSAAYIMPPPRLGEARKHANHLRLVELMMRDGAPEKVAGAASMRAAFQVLEGYPGMGAFLAYQYLIDLNYAAGKCFGPAATGIEADVYPVHGGGSRSSKRATVCLQLPSSCNTSRPPEQAVTVRP